MTTVAINPEQLARTLERGLAACYLVSGDETLLVSECAEQIRARAVRDGYAERTVWTVEPGFDWDNLRTATQSLSLFSERRLIELRLPTGKPGESGAALIAEFAGQPPADTLLLVISGKLDKTQRESEWVQAMESTGTHVQVWPLEPQRLPGWISQRLKARGLAVEAGVVDVLAWHLEGNLLAAAQEIDKLAMLVGSGTVRLADVEQSLADSARFTVFQLVDTALAGNAAAARRMLTSLRAEGTEPILILWSLARELRSFVPMALERARGRPEATVLARVWQNRRALVGQALRRHPPAVWPVFLRRAAFVDRVLKGRATGDVWLELERLVLALAGVGVCAGFPESLERTA
jgi:DNA polymerase-3 subunit delta